MASLRRRQGTLEDELLELMQQREPLEAELGVLTTGRERLTADQANSARTATLPRSISTGS